MLTEGQRALRFYPQSKARRPLREVGYSRLSRVLRGLWEVGSASAPLRGVSEFRTERLHWFWMFLSRSTPHCSAFNRKTQRQTWCLKTSVPGPFLVSAAARTISCLCSHQGSAKPPGCSPQPPCTVIAANLPVTPPCSWGLRGGAGAPSLDAVGGLTHGQSWSVTDGGE